MLKILQIVPAPNTAITTLAEQIARNAPSDLEVKTLSFHPKKPDENEKKKFLTCVKWCDILDMQYWKSASKIKEMYPSEFNSKPKILTHYNPYNLNEEKWEEYKFVCVVNNYQKSILPNALMMPLCIDTSFFKFNRSNYTIEPIVNMSVNRIEGKKGVYEVAKACKELNYKFILVGRISDGGYMDRVKKVCGDNLIFRNNATLDLLLKSYHESAVHVCNSVENFESGTMPILESMSAGLPVFTRSVGHVPDIANENNMVVSDHHPEDVEKLKEGLSKLMRDRRKRIKMRIAAQEFVQSRDEKIRAKMYYNLYKKTI